MTHIPRTDPDERGICELSGRPCGYEGDDSECEEASDD